jgi:hypothetical protein
MLKSAALWRLYIYQIMYILGFPRRLLLPSTAILLAESELAVKLVGRASFLLLVPSQLEIECGNSKLD